jgi:thymidylate kinase
MKSPIVIDFLGLPGCGKSTVSSLVASELRMKGFNVSEKVYSIGNQLSLGRRYAVKLSYATGLALSHPRTAIELVKQCAPNMFRSKSEMLKQQINVFYVLETIRREKKAICVADQGIAQAVASLCVWKQGSVSCSERIRTYMHYVQRPIVFVYLRCDKETALQRIALRKNGFSRVEAERIESDREEMLSIFEKSIECVAQCLPRLITVDISAQTQTAVQYAQEVTCKLEELCL